MRVLELLPRSILLAALCLAGGQPAIADSTPSEMVVEATIPRSGFSIAFGFDALWMMSDGRLARISAADNSVTDIAVPAGEGGMLLAEIDRYRGIAIGEGAVWIPDVGNSAIYKVDPQSNAVLLTIPTFIVGGAGSIGVGAGAVWVVTFDDHDKTLTRYNAESGQQEATIALPRPCKAVVADFGKVWVAAANAPELYVIDPATNRLTATVQTHATSHILASGIGSVWIGYDTEGLVDRVDGARGEVASTLATGVSDMESDGDIAVGGGYVWMITRGSVLVQIDPKTNAVKEAFRPPVGTLMGRRVRFGGGSIWVSGASVFRVKVPN